MANLHLIASSPSKTRLDELRATISQADALLFIEDGVYFAATNDILTSLPTQEIFFLSDDAAARSIELSARAVDYAGFVDLTVQYERSVSWY